MERDIVLILLPPCPFLSASQRKSKDEFLLNLIYKLSAPGRWIEFSPPTNAIPTVNSIDNRLWNPHSWRRERHPAAIWPLQEFAPATKRIPTEIPIKNPIWNSHGCRSKHIDSAQCSAPATAIAIRSGYMGLSLVIFCHLPLIPYLTQSRYFVIWPSRFQRLNST